MSIELTSKWGAMVPGIGVEITDAVDQGLNSYMPGVLSVLHTESTDALQVHYTEFTDFQGFGYREEAQNAKEQTRHKGFDSEYVVDKMSGQINVSVESIRYNKFASELSTAKSQGRDVMRFKDKLGYQLFNAGFDTNAREKNGFKINWFGDNKPQFSVSHPSAITGGSSQSNASATNLALASEDQLETASLALEFQRQDNGELLDLAGTLTLLVPKQLERTARIITESVKSTGNNYNDVNIYADGTFDVVCSKYLSDTTIGGSTTAWYMVDSISHALNMIESGSTEIEEDYDPKNRVYTYVVHGYGTVASKGWKGTWASKGTGSGSYTA